MERLLDELDSEFIGDGWFCKRGADGDFDVAGWLRACEFYGVGEEVDEDSV